MSLNWKAPQPTTEAFALSLCAALKDERELTETNFVKVWRELMAQRIFMVDGKHLADCTITNQLIIFDHMHSMIGFRFWHGWAENEPDYSGLDQLAHQ